MLQVSFYALPSSVLGNDKHSLLREAYCWYLFADTATLPDLLNDALILAKRLEFDVFNALEIGENDRFLQVRNSPHCSLRSPLSPATCPAARASDASNLQTEPAPARFPSRTLLLAPNLNPGAEVRHRRRHSSVLPV